MDLTQSVILSIIIVLTIFIVVLGFQVFFVLRDFRKTLHRTNRLLDDADNLLTQVKRPVETVGNLLTSAAAGVGLAHLFKRLTKHGRD